MVSLKQLCLFLSLFICHTDALQCSPFSRRSFIGNLITGTVAGTVIATNGNVAWAAETRTTASANSDSNRAKRSKTLRGGKEVMDATHNGTELNEKEVNVAGGLLDKMGVPDITPDRGFTSRR